MASITGSKHLCDFAVKDFYQKITEEGTHPLQQYITCHGNQDSTRASGECLDAMRKLRQLHDHDIKQSTAEERTTIEMVDTPVGPVPSNQEIKNAKKYTGGNLSSLQTMGKMLGSFQKAMTSFIDMLISSEILVPDDNEQNTSSDEVQLDRTQHPQEEIFNYHMGFKTEHFGARFAAQKQEQDTYLQLVQDGEGRQAVSFSNFQDRASDTYEVLIQN